MKPRRNTLLFLIHQAFYDLSLDFYIVGEPASDIDLAFYDLCFDPYCRPTSQRP